MRFAFTRFTVAASVNSAPLNKSRCAVERRLLGERDDGTYAEFVRVPAQNCFAMPGRLSFEEAAAFPLVYVMAWRMLITQADLKPGESVLIVGAGGGIATAALQIAVGHGSARHRHLSDNEEKLSAAGKLGAEHGIHCRSIRIRQSRAQLHRQARRRCCRQLRRRRELGGVSCCSRSRRPIGRLAAPLPDAQPKTDLRRVFWNHLKLCAANSRNTARISAGVEFFRRFTAQTDHRSSLSVERCRCRHSGDWKKGRQFGKIVLRMDS